MSSSPGERLYYRPSIGATSSSSRLAASFGEGRVCQDEILQLGERKLTFAEAVREDPILRKLVGPLPDSRPVAKRPWLAELRFRFEVWHRVVREGDLSLAHYLETIDRLRARLALAESESVAVKAWQEKVRSALRALREQRQSAVATLLGNYQGELVDYLGQIAAIVQSARDSLCDTIAVCHERQAICGQYVEALDSLVTAFIRPSSRVIRCRDARPWKPIAKALEKFASSVSPTRVFAIYRGGGATGILLAHDGIHLSNGKAGHFIPWSTDIELVSQGWFFRKTIVRGVQVVGRLRHATDSTLQPFLEGIHAISTHLPPTPAMLDEYAAIEMLDGAMRSFPPPPCFELPELTAMLTDCFDQEIAASLSEM